MRGQQGAAGEVIELLAQKSGRHPMGIVALPGDGVLGELQVYNLNKSKSWSSNGIMWKCFRFKIP